MKNLSLLLTIILLNINGYCQPAPQNWNWYFGVHAAINFSSGNPSPLTGSVIYQSQGCATISDTSGNLLFYTDGVSVLNRNNAPMPNGGLHGNYSSAQSALIVPKPDSANIYYIFTSDAATGINGICYSEVDMTLNAGLGNVTVKNVQLVTPACEKLTAIRHCNGDDYWVIAHHWGDDAYYSYLVSNTGVSSPIITNIGMVTNSNSDYIGYLKASPNSQKIAAAIHGSSVLELYDFDNATGILSNLITLPFNAGLYPYGVSFSPDNTKLYVSGGLNSLSNLYQFDISSSNQATIITSQYQVTVFVGPGGAQQLDPDNKIYIAINGSHNLDVINSPNSSGAGCNYASQSVSIGTGFCQYGLPNFIDANNSTYNCQTTGTLKYLNMNQISLYPNPNDGTFTISNLRFGMDDLIIKDVLERTVYTKSFKFSNGKETIALNLSDGIYFWELISKDKNPSKGKILIKNLVR